MLLEGRLRGGLASISGAIPVATPAPGESRMIPRPDGTYQAVPAARGRIKVFHLVERPAPWTLKPGLTVMANTYNGVVPGPVLQVRARRHGRHRLHE